MAFTTSVHSENANPVSVQLKTKTQTQREGARENNRRSQEHQQQQWTAWLRGGKEPGQECNRWKTSEEKGQLELLTPSCVSHPESPAPSSSKLTILSDFLFFFFYTYGLFTRNTKGMPYFL